MDSTINNHQVNINDTIKTVVTEYIPPYIAASRVAANDYNLLPPNPLDNNGFHLVYRSGWYWRAYDVMALVGPFHTEEDAIKDAS